MRDVAGGHAGLKYAVPFVLFVRKDRTFFIENVDEAVQHADQGRTGAQAEARWHKGGVGREVSRAVAGHADEGQAHELIGQFRIHEEAKILAPYSDRFFVAARILIGHDLFDGQVANGVGGTVQTGVLALAQVDWSREIQDQVIGDGRKQRREVSRRWGGIRPWQVERQSVFKEASCVREGNRPIAERVVIDLKGGEAERIAPQARRYKVERIFEITVLCLKVVRAEIHAFRPDRFGELSHIVSPPVAEGSTTPSAG